MGVQIPCGVHSEVPAQDVVLKAEDAPGEVFRQLAQPKESPILESHLMLVHVHMLIAIPPKYAVSQVMWCSKGKSAIHIARAYGERKRNFVRQQFWARG